MRQRQNRRGAFTLIELLVVFGIIALLAAILLPALGRAREVAKSVACMSNLHSIGLALHTYVAAYEDYYPMDYQYNNGEGEGPSTGDGLIGRLLPLDGGAGTRPVRRSVFYVTQNDATCRGQQATPALSDAGAELRLPFAHAARICADELHLVRIPSPPPGQSARRRMWPDR